MNENILLMRKAKFLLAGQWMEAFVGSLIYTLLMAAASYIGFGEFIIGGSLTFGYFLYLTSLVDRRQSDYNLVFRGFNRFVETLVAGLIYYLAIFVGAILLIVPGIIAYCGLSMTFYIMVDNPNISGLDAIKQSWEMMKGQKWNFFCLQMRFFGWILLCVLTAGIGYIFLSPYMTVTNLNFYRKLRYGTF